MGRADGVCRVRWKRRGAIKAKMAEHFLTDYQALIGPA
jgi:hypothetical protein